MTSTKTLYRVEVTTGTPQDRGRGQTCVSEVLYCGYDRFIAYQVWAASRALDFGGDNYTGSQRYTRCKTGQICGDE